MKKNTKSSSGVSASTIMEIGAGVAALATASYYLFGPKGKAHRDHMKGWMIKMKGEIVDRIEDVKELTQPVYDGIVDSVVAAYATHAKVGKEELGMFADTLKSQWKDIVKAAQTKKGPVKKLKKATKK